MSKKKKRNKRSSKPASKQNFGQTLQSSSEVRLSQCMIVKNEEKNIRRALEWAKPIVYEQIVVDTGSTDKTVEIAEEMGAKVYHFKWIDDFSAAKNYAIEQATGNWIAFLDADEYMESKDAGKLIEKLNEIEKAKNITVLRTPMLDLDDDGNTSEVFLHTRIYRNKKDIRYFGRIHETLAVYGESFIADDISIIHTGYTEAEHKEKNKTDRNIKLLRKELENNPNEILVKAYLADSLKSKVTLDEKEGKKPDKKEEKEALELFKEVIESKEQIPEFLIKKAYIYHIGKVWKDEEKASQREELCKEGNKRFPDDLDLGYYYSVVLNESRKFKEAWDVLKRLEMKLTTGQGHITGASAKMQSDPNMIFGQLLMAAQGLGDVDSTISYATLLLMSDKTQQEILSPYISTLQKSGISDDDMFGLLSKIYNTTSPADLLLIARAAKDCGAISFTKFILGRAQSQMN